MIMHSQHDTPLSQESDSNESAARFVVAKYVADLRRMEPKNIGVIVWNNGEVASRFLSADEAEFVTDSATYNRWLQFWERETSRPILSVPRMPPVERGDPTYLDVLRRTQKGNYRLEDGGEFLHAIGGKTADAADFLFDQLISVRAAVEATDSTEAAESMQRSCRNVFERAGLWEQPQFHKSSAGFNVSCKIHRVEQQVNFHYAIADAHVQAVFHRVNLKLDPNWQSAVLRFESLRKKVDKGRRVSLIHTDDEMQSNHKIKATIAVLEDVSLVADLSDPDAAARIIAQAA